MPTMPSRLSAIVLDCRDVARTAAFWSAVLDEPLDDWGNQWARSLGRDGDGPGMLFLAVEQRAEGRNQVHLDLVADDLDAEVARVVALGAQRQERHDEYGITWVTLLDPEGNLFDIAAPH